MTAGGRAGVRPVALVAGLWWPPRTCHIQDLALPAPAARRARRTLGSARAGIANAFLLDSTTKHPKKSQFERRGLCCCASRDESGDEESGGLGRVPEPRVLIFPGEQE